MAESPESPSVVDEAPRTAELSAHETDSADSSRAPSPLDKPLPQPPTQEEEEDEQDEQDERDAEHEGSTTPVGDAPPITVDPPEPASAPTSIQTPSTSTRDRADSHSTSATSVDPPGKLKTSLYFVVSALESINASRDASRIKDLKALTQRALDAIKSKSDSQQIDPRILFEPLRLATEATTEAVVVSALDCLGTLISYSYFSTPLQSSENTSESLIDQAIDTICGCFEGEATPDRIQLQIIMTLLTAVLNDKVVVHESGLLKAVRQMYNIYLYSKSSNSQRVAQGALSQMVGTVFERAKTRVTAKEARLGLSRTPAGDKQDPDAIATPSRTSLANGEMEDEEPRDTPAEKDRSAKMTLQTFERRGSFDDEKLKEGPTMVTRADGRRSSAAHAQDGADDEEDGDTREALSEEDREDEVYIRDAFLVFRAMCKISIKSLRPDEIANERSQGMRAKLLSLHIIHTILFNHVSFFTSPHATIRSSNNQNDPTPFIQAIKQLLCQSLSRNGASSVSRVFEVGCEIFWIMLKHLRVLLKKEVEVFLKEVYLSILDNRNAPLFQKQCFLNVLERLAGDSRALVEVYLNYDCDRTASDNMFQRIIEHLSRMSSTSVSVTSIQFQAYQANPTKRSTLADWQTKGSIPPSLSSVATGAQVENDEKYPVEYAMKQQSLESLVGTLRSLVHWAQQGISNQLATSSDVDSRVSSDEARESVDNRLSGTMPSPNIGAASEVSTPAGTPLAEDDPAALEKAKARKIALSNAIRQFNFKPKRGVKTLIENGFILSDGPEDIAKFFLTNGTQFDKAALGEYLGEADPENIAVMHAFVNGMDFTRTRFVDALRRFLQSFRLPGEAQKIDRFMLKFAEHYMVGNPNAYANADTAYVLSYSVIMLNVDQHSAKVKGNRMTLEDFVKNNRGINDNSDLPEDYLKGIYDDIRQNEIVLETERENEENKGRAQPTPAAGFGIAAAFGANNRETQQREAFMQRSEAMANKTEQLFRSLLRAQRKSGSSSDQIAKFIPATSFKHVGPMFEVVWMPFLTALSGCAQDTANMETVRLCMDGLKLAIQISCMFDLSNPRQAFVSSIARFTNLYNLSEMQTKNVEALRVLLDVAHTEGNNLKGSWRDILTCVSQLDRFQLISEGVPEKALPDVLRAQPANRRGQGGKGSLQVPQRNRNTASNSSTNYRAEIAEESRSAGIVNGVDRIFTGSSRLSGSAIVDFVKALTQVSWQEIESSGQSQEPRTFSLQKIAEVSEYNMGRVRFEWKNIWQVLGEHFNQVGCHNNTKVVHFALNSLRQLSVRFLDLEELPGFKFQKDFLKPFEHIIANTAVIQVKEIVLHSLIQMIQARGENIRSGWRTIFGVFTVAARERYEGIVNLAYENVISVYNERLATVITQGAFADLMVCLTEFAKNARFQKKSLQAIETLKSSIPKMLKTGSTPMQPTRQTQEEQLFFPLLFSFHDILMTGEDLEVRSRALNYLFDALIKYGTDFPRDFWDVVYRQLLYPIFLVLKSRSEMSKVVNHEELSVWLSTTMIQALRNMISLFTHFFGALEYMLDRWLELLALCICQENDTLARIGSNCLQTLILQNVHKYNEQHWSQIVNAFVDLFVKTEATALFSAAAASYGSTPTQQVNGAPPPTTSSMTNGTDLQLAPTISNDRRSSVTSQNGKPSLAPSMPNGGNGPSSGMTSPVSEAPPTPGSALEDYRPQDNSIQQPSVVVTAARRRFFNQIITKCVLQLLMIETVNELFTNDDVYQLIPSSELLSLMSLLKKSYQFAKRFNDDLDLRNRLYSEGFMRQPPNLLKQESGSASVYVNILFRMYTDPSPQRVASRKDTEAALIPLCADIIEAYALLREETQQRNIVTWRPVVVDVIEGYTSLPQDSFAEHAPRFAPLATDLMGREMGAELQRAVQALLHRILGLHYEMGNLECPMPATPASPRGGVFGTRRRSRGQSVSVTTSVASGMDGKSAVGGSAVSMPGV